MTTPVLDVVVPVHNEQAIVAACVQRLHRHLTDTFPYPFRITIADNASTDHTYAVAQQLAGTTSGVRVVRLAEKGRGRALKQVWSASDAPILAYMDVDLSTDLDALWPLVAPLMSGHSDLAIGSRLRHGARVVRGAKREVISRCYNLILRATLGARFSDAQCGFKAIRKDVADELLPLVEDPDWFFDTELLVLAERSGLRVHEVPVDWFDDPDSRVDLAATATADLRGVWRMRRGLWSGSLPVEQIARRIGRAAPVTGMTGQVSRFAVVGLLTTVLHLGLFALLQGGLPAQGANLIALLAGTVANTSLNRRWTFGVRGRTGAARQQVQALAVFGLTLALTAAGLALVHLGSVDPPTWLETAAIAVATLTSTALKFLVMRMWIFPRTPRAAGARPVPKDPTTSLSGPSGWGGGGGI